MGNEESQKRSIPDSQFPIPNSQFSNNMSRTYKATGINLKTMPLGESDRLLTILTREFGLIKAVAPGSRKHHSRLGGRSEMFVVNDLLIAKGRSLDKITQAETVESYPRLSQDLAKLAASQYLAEIVLCHALSEQPQEELFCLLSSHLERLAELPSSNNEKSFAVLAHLAHAVFHILALAGIAPQVQNCCLTQQPLTPDFTSSDWRVGFSAAAGGTVSLAALAKLQAEGQLLVAGRSKMSRSLYTAQQVPLGVSKQNTNNYGSGIGSAIEQPETLALNTQLSATELALLQQLSKPQLPQIQENSFHLFFSDPRWLGVERILRQYTQYQFGRQIRSAALIDTFFGSLPICSSSHDAMV